MIMIFTALYCEAKPLIRFFGLKKAPEFTLFQVYKNEDIVLMVTKPGIINAAISVTHLCSVYSPNPCDFLFNIGICGSNNKNMPLGTVYLCNKICDAETGRSFYPDMIYTHPFDESGIVSCSSPILEKNSEYMSENLADMEAAGVYQAGALFFQQHQMFFVKIVSDHLQFKKIEPEYVSRLIQDNVSEIAAWIVRLHNGTIDSPPMFTKEEDDILTQASNNLRLSVSMQHQLRQAMRYYKLQYGSFSGYLSAFIENTALPVKNKNERKKCFEQLLQNFI